MRIHEEFYKIRSDLKSMKDYEKIMMVFIFS